ncbi:heterokaryon incompatibility protein-domain-containing protein [Bisporella sp. PMI_857]|nr:heterokaryon incompatibility protein-domain-containing protein [Bisporella sp. PMI_857]
MWELFKSRRPQKASEARDVAASIDGEASTETASSSGIEPQAASNSLAIINAQSATANLAGGAKRCHLQSFSHSPLPSPEHTRMLILDPGCGEDELSCNLETAELIRVQDDYIALSYVWGDAAYKTPILCDGKVMQITLNLAEALRGLRDPVAPKRLWADAICIDQTNNVEKNHQVKRMGTIYTSAGQVVVWLGNDNEDIARDCFDLIRSTNSYLDQQLAAYGTVLGIPTLAKPYPICDDRLRWDKARKLLSLSWFTRVWVIQEAGLAKRCTLQWGQYELDFSHIMELALWQFHREDVATVIGPLKLARLNNLCRHIYRTYDNSITWRTNLPLVREVMEDNKNQLFLDVLFAASGMGAADKRDHVFAFLGGPLSFQPDGQPLVEPDYNKDLLDVNYETACSFLRHPREAPFLLSRVKHLSLNNLGDPNIPSWIPRWDTATEFTISRHYFWYHAGGTSNFRPEIRGDRTLAVQGIIIGSVVFTSRIIYKHNIGTDPNAWDEEYRAARKPFIDVLWQETLQAASPATGRLENEFAWTLARAFPATPGKTCDAQHMAEFATYRHLLRSAASESNSQPALGHDIEAFPRNFMHRLNYCDDLRVAVLDSAQSGRLGLVPHVARPGDCCCILLGVPVPMILRHVADNRYILVGESYIDGVMAGEIVESQAEGRVKEALVIIT